MQIKEAKDIGELIRESREQKELTQREVAFASGVGIRFISDIENGKATCRIDKVLRVVKILGISITANIE